MTTDFDHLNNILWFFKSKDFLAEEPYVKKDILQKLNILMNDLAVTSPSTAISATRLSYTIAKALSAGIKFFTPYESAQLTMAIPNPKYFLDFYPGGNDVGFSRAVEWEEQFKLRELLYQWMIVFNNDQLMDFAHRENLSLRNAIADKLEAFAYTHLGSPYAPTAFHFIDQTDQMLAKVKYYEWLSK